VTRCCSKK